MPPALPSSSAADAVARLNAAEAEAEAYERTHVHGVYEAIAPHFSATRYKPWPAVASFLRAQPPGAVGLDVGCGNGKYLGVNPDVFMLGSDRSPSLIALARDRCKQLQAQQQQQQQQQQQEHEQEHEQGCAAAGRGTGGGGGGAAAASDVLVADGLSLPFREGAADFAICVAVIHHLSTRARRREAIRQLLRCVGPREAGRAGGGQVLLYVWALEQGSSRRGWDEGGEQDLLVPWVMKTQQHKAQKGGAQNQGIGAGAGAGEGAGDKSGEAPSVPVAAAAAAAAAVPAAPASAPGHTDPVFQRYYHLYRKGELEEDVLAAGGTVVASGYEKDNWWVVAANGPVHENQQ